MTPDWTPELLDEEGRRAGKAISWARSARAGEFKKDPYENLNIEGNLQLYSIFSALLVSFAFGQSSLPFLEKIGFETSEVDACINALQVPALALIAASILSSGVCGFGLAPTKNRSTFAWAIKGLAGGKSN